MQKKHRLTFVLTTALAGAAPAGAALAQQPSRPPATAPQQTQPQTKITMKDARARALREVPGTVVKEELTQENGKWLYSFDIRPTGASATAATRMVRIDANDGTVVRTQGSQSGKQGQ